MALILQIALGIIVALIILAALPYLIVLAVFAAFFAAVTAVFTYAGTEIFVLPLNEAMLYGAIVAAIVLIGYLAIPDR
jgi:hypothetical protein